jgi:hypothetical protein
MGGSRRAQLFVVSETPFSEKGISSWTLSIGKDSSWKVFEDRASVRSAGMMVFFQEFPWLWKELRGHSVELEI